MEFQLCGEGRGGGNRSTHYRKPAAQRKFLDRYAFLICLGGGFAPKARHRANPYRR